ncbi:hypothetical protein PT974_08693 [Cladobotryum mycophilum]|uniref:Uncharacterized protein n=1 Tax=Cladobotryum mycophilum TaxID=491253 RepID=A0ABR0SF74_9HYPO
MAWSLAVACCGFAFSSDWNPIMKLQQYGDADVRELQCEDFRHPRIVGHVRDSAIFQFGLHDDHW